nr:immunoglobulin heavy chain junction region [Macaca mulatta]MOV47582.1 immunoglobulin heavy chain junction region [Macaca mulatta]MOV47679.1 immunoglobulin heavy chain junction region [Macaca mulatta]MOV47684.1 immunoglobulin heavy chain junction region [Macaca mulatta]MOV47703.1 immunoglobulin heavy chain junction region [Macaca mulatta]
CVRRTYLFGYFEFW